MKRSFPAPPDRSRALRPWLMPALTVFVALLIFWPRGLDTDAVQRDFSAARGDLALARLAQASLSELPPEWPAALVGEAFFPRERRVALLAALAARPPEERIETPGTPVVLAPRGLQLGRPETVTLTAPAERELRLEVHCISLGLPAGERSWPAGAQSLPLPETLRDGLQYALVLRDAQDDTLAGLTEFSVAPPAQAAAITDAIAQAHALGRPSHEGAVLLSALAAFHEQAFAEALARLALLHDRPGWERLSRELSALALERLGLDLQARRLLGLPDGD